MFTKSDMEIMAAKFRKIRPVRREPTEGETYDEVTREYQVSMNDWKFYRNHIADAMCESNWRFKRDVFIAATEK